MRYHDHVPSRAWAGFLSTTGVSLIASTAVAQDTATIGAATALFDEASKLMEERKYAAACPKLARSQELAPSGGTLLALAACYEKNEQLASAWVKYKEAAARASEARKPDAERAALDAAARLEPRLSKVAVHVTPAADVPGLVVRRDGKPLSRAEWGVLVPLDPGAHFFDATAPGKRSWSGRVNLGLSASTKTLLVPLLEDEEVAGVPVGAGEVAPPGRAQRAAAIALGLIGLAGLATGSIFGLRAASKNSEASKHCRDDTRCDAEGIRLDQQGRDAGTVSTIAFVVGGVALAGGAVLLLTAPSGASTSVGVRGTANGLWLSAGGSF